MIRPKIILEDGKPKEVILPIADYEALLEQAEQTEDLRVIREMTDQDKQTVSWEEFTRGLRGDVPS